MLVHELMDVGVVIHHEDVEFKIGTDDLIESFWDEDSYCAFQDDEELVSHVTIPAKDCLLLVQLHLHLAVYFVHCGEAIVAILVVVTSVTQEIVLSHEIVMHCLIVLSCSFL